MNARLISNLGALVAALIFGASVVAVRFAGRELGPFTLAMLRFLQGGGILLVLTLLIRRHWLRLERKDVAYLVLLGAMGFALFPLLFNLSLRFTEASRGSLMLATGPLLSAIVSRAAKKESLTLRQISGTVLAFLGVALTLVERGLNLASGAGGTALLGDILMIAATLAGVFYGVMAKRVLAKYKALAVTAYAMLAGALLLAPAATLENPVASVMQAQPYTIWAVVFVGIAGGAIGYFLWTYALAHLSPTQVSVYVNLNPMVATILGATMLGERLTPMFLVGLVSVIGGVLLVNLPVARKGVPGA